ncbi:MAG: 1,2-phenylacetyl-CoA epoxidase subunit PaaD [Rhizobiaceae bacterium]
MSAALELPRDDRPAYPDPQEVMAWLEEVPDPEIPVISLVDLGVIRNVSLDGGTLVVTVTPTYTGCPATSIINFEIEAKLREKGVCDFRIVRSLSPPWTTAWLSVKGRAALTQYGIAPPVEGTAACGSGRPAQLQVACPRCGSCETRMVSRFGSTPCKSNWQCNSCLEPFDYFKCI